MLRAEIARAKFLGTITTLDRATLEQWIEAAIEHLDAIDGDPDAEDDDPAGDWLDERGEQPASCGHELLTTRPIYALDQSRGPVNERQAILACDAARARRAY